MLVDLGFGRGSRGTGFVFNWVLANGKKVSFVLTCAHVFAEAQGGHLKVHSNISCYTMWNGHTSYRKKYRVLKAMVHPAWRGSPATGFDYAIGILGSPEIGDIDIPDEEINDDFFIAQVGPTAERILMNSHGVIAGYPGSWGNTMAEHSGNFLEVKTCRRGQYTGRYVRYNIDTTGGNSGGPVWCDDADALSALRQEKGFDEDGDDDRCLVGCVTGGNSLGENFGTLITPEIMDWTISRLTENADLSGSDTSIQPGQVTRPRPGNGGRDWRPSNRGGGGASGYTMADLRAV